MRVRMNDADFYHDDDADGAELDEHAWWWFNH